MIKSITLAYKKPGMSNEEFNRYWKEQHGPLAAKMIPGMRKYVQNHFVQAPGFKFEADGMVEMWYDDFDSFKKSLEFLGTPAGRPLAEDGAKFCGRGPTGGGSMWLAEEYIIKDEISKK
jgi:uncharacterized protein (TIGR02118 family)